MTMVNSYIFSGLGFVVGEYQISNNDILNSIKTSYLKGFNENRILESEAYCEYKKTNQNKSAFDYLAEDGMGFKYRYSVVPFPPTKPKYNDAKNSLDLCVEATEKALNDAGVSGNDIDAWFVGTATAHQIAPGIAEFLKSYFTDIDNQKPTFSLCSACVGFNINLENAIAFFEEHKNAKHIVVAHAEVMTELLTNESDFVPFVTFGDSAAAIVVSKVPTEKKCGITNICNFEDSAMLDFLGANKKGMLFMNPRMVKYRAVPNIIKAMDTIMQKDNLQHKDYDIIIPHQTGNAIVHSVAKKLDIPLSKIYQDVQYTFGNLSGASVPTAIACLKNKGNLKPNHKILTGVAGLGGEFGGFSYTVPEKIYKFSPKKELNNKTIFITGASGGIGQLIAKFAAKEGANLILHFNSNKEKADKLKNDLVAEYGVNIELWQADLSNISHIIDYKNKLSSHNTNINHLIITHAITGSLSKASEVCTDEFRQILNANYFSVKNLTEQFKNLITESCLITGSVGEDAQFPGSAPYVASKRALRGYAVNFADQMYQKNVRCIYYLPGLIDTGMISKLDNAQIQASMMMIGQKELINQDTIAMRMLKSVYRLKTSNVRISFESNLKVIKDGYLRY